MSDKQNQLNAFWSEIKSTLKLNIDYARLTAAEKITMLLSAATLAVLGIVLVSLVMFFLSLALIRCIASGVGLIWAYFIMSAFYLLVIVIIYALRKQLIINPIARFVSRLFFNP